MYEMENVIPFTRTAPDGKLKLHEAAAMMMDCCQFQEYQETGLCQYLRQNHIAIFLFSIQIDILRMPEFREKVKTAVKIYGCKSIYGLRRITMRDESGELCLISNATGAFFDTVAGKALKLDPSDFNVKYDEPEEMECLPRKIPVPGDSWQKMSPVTVLRSDLDINGHLTTPAYFAVANNVLPEDFSFNRLRFEFKKQAKAGETIYPQLYLEGSSKAIVDLKGSDGLSYAIAEFSNF